MTNTAPDTPASDASDAFTPGLDGMQPGQQARARVRGAVEFRAGDGPLIKILPDRELELERAPLSMVVSWEDDGQPMNAAIPVVQFDEFIRDGKIAIDA